MRSKADETLVIVETLLCFSFSLSVFASIYLAMQKKCFLFENVFGSVIN